MVSPAGIATIDVGDPGEAANRVAAQLSDGNDANGEADIVVLLVHEGAVTTALSSALDETTRFGKIVDQTVMQPNSNIDAIVSGHSHLAYNHVINGHPVISSGQYGERYSKMDITFDKKTKSFTMNNQIFTMMDGTTALYPDDPAVKPIVDAAVLAAEGRAASCSAPRPPTSAGPCPPSRWPASRCPRTVVASRRSATWSPTSSSGRWSRTAPGTSTSPS